MDRHCDKLDQHVLSGKDKHRYDELRIQGDNKHNRKVLDDGQGELILARRPTTSFTSRQFGPCPFCYEWMKMNTIPIHQRKCKKAKWRELLSTSSPPPAAGQANASTSTAPAEENTSSSPARTQVNASTSAAPAEENTTSSPPPAAMPTATKSKRVLLMKSDVLAGRIKTKPSKHLFDEVFTIMTRDEVSRIAQNDQLIVELGDSWLQRSIGNPKAKYYSSGHMRLMARLLLHLRNKEVGTADEMNRGTDDPKVSKRMWDFLVPGHFPDVALAALQCALPFLDDDQDLAAPTNAIRLKYDVVRLLDFKWSLIHTDHQGTPKDAADCDVFKRLMEIHWCHKVTRVARNVLLQRSFTKDVEIPSPEDMHTLTCYVVQQLKALDFTKEDGVTFRRAITLAQARLLMYNKRRSGEIDGIR